MASGGVLAGGVDPGAEEWRARKVAVIPLAMTVAAPIHAAAGMRDFVVRAFEPVFSEPRAGNPVPRRTPRAWRVGRGGV